MGTFDRTRLAVAAVAVCAALAIAGKLAEVDWMVWVFKPLATVVITLIAALRVRLATDGGTPAARAVDPSAPYARAILAGLMLSLAGDVLLIPPHLFVAGLVAFLLAHVAYLYAFTRQTALFARRAPWLVVAAIAFAVLALLWPRLPHALRVPVLCYVAMLAAMVAQAWTRAAVRNDRFARRAALGGALFLVSDALLAIDRFHTPLPLAALLVLGTYWPAQLLIALSVRPPGQGARPADDGGAESAARER